MTHGTPLLVVTVPARSVAEAREEVARAREAGADLAEVRFDRWPAAELSQVAALFPSPLPLVATLRSRAEGGEGPDRPEERTALLSTLAGLPFAYLDLEAGRDDPAVLGQDRRSMEPPPRPIRSTHFPAGTSVEVLLRALQEPVPPHALRKLVLPLSTGRLLTDLLPRLTPSTLGSERVVLTTGGSGPLLRALGKAVGLPWVYACLPGRPGAPGHPAVEEAQLPVDQLRRYFDAPGRPPLFAVVGHPVRHSLSPWVHGTWIRRSGRVGLYFPLDIASDEELRSTLARLGTIGFRGVNVTHPWKPAALAAATRASLAARECGAANCLTVTEKEVVADNTDVSAARRRLEELRAEGTWSGEELTVLGGGGAARATLVAARALRARATLLTRRRPVTEEVARAFAAEVGDPNHPVSSPLVVQATSAGHDVRRPLELPLPELIGPGTYVLDWVYGGTDASVARAAQRAGATYEGGERLLVYQAAASFEAWWGEPPPADAVHEVLREVGCAG